MSQEQLIPPSSLKITLNLNIGDSLELEPGVYKTVLTHPDFAGELWFVHGENDRDKILELKNENPIAGALGVISSVVELFQEKNGKQNKRKTPL